MNVEGKHCTEITRQHAATFMLSNRQRPISTLVFTSAYRTTRRRVDVDLPENDVNDPFLTIDLGVRTC